MRITNGHGVIWNTLCETKLLNEAKTDIRDNVINSIPDVSIGDPTRISVDFPLCEFYKSSTLSTVFKGRFNQLKGKSSVFTCALTGLYSKQNCFLYMLVIVEQQAII